jgi:phenylalanyl-tRNA synthetase alpha chain
LAGLSAQSRTYAGSNRGGTAEAGKLSSRGARAFFVGFGEGSCSLGDDRKAKDQKTGDGGELVARLTGARAAALEAVERASAAGELEEVRIRFLGRNGEITQVLRALGALPSDIRPELGRRANETRLEVEAVLASRAARLKEADLDRRLLSERVDITLPGTVPQAGTLHPISLTLLELTRIFTAIGFEMVEGPEIETDWYNFQALNIPRDHPARDMQASFYFTEDILLRTQTSPVQIRYMQAHAPRLPVRIIAPGRVYRRDDDATHSPVFHQVEMLVVDRGINMGDLKGVVGVFAREMFGPETRVRFRPSYFPFTEPSAEVDLSCTICRGDGCRVCKGTGWLEILGAGMVHPQVLRNGGYDPESVSGFAFGLGIERVAMLRYGIADIRHLFGGDVRFLRQFCPAGEGRVQA